MAMVAAAIIVSLAAVIAEHRNVTKGDQGPGLPDEQRQDVANTLVDSNGLGESRRVQHAPIDESAQDAGVEVRVLSAEGHVLNAHCFLLVDGERVPAETGSISGQGAYFREGLWKQSAGLGVAAQGFASEYIRWSEAAIPADGVYTVYLEADCSLVGAIHGPKSTTFKLVAVRSRDMFTDERGKSIAMGWVQDAVVLKGSADSSGGFQIDGASPSEEYVVYAYADGAVANRPTVMRCNKFQGFQSYVVYAAVVSVVDGGGEPLLGGAVYGGTPSWSIEGVEGLTEWPRTRAEIALCGLEEHYRVWSGSLKRDFTYFVYCAKEDMGEIAGYLSFNHRPIGYEEIDASVPLVAVAGDGVEVTEIVASLTAEKWGGINVDVVLPDSVPHSAVLEPGGDMLGKLSLWDEYGRKFGVVVGGGSPAGRAEIMVPEGQYQFRYQSEWGDWTFPEDGSRGRISCVGGAVVDLRLDLRSIGVVVFDVMKADGTAWHGDCELSVDVKSSGRFFGDSAKWHGVPPFYLVGVPPGEHKITALLGGGQQRQENDFVIWVQDGESSPVFCPLYY